LPVNHVVASPSANGATLVKSDTGVEVCVNTAKHVEETPEAAPTPTPAVKVAPTPAPAEKAAPAPAEKAAPASADKATPSAEKGPSAPAPALTKDVTKKTYASIVSS
jgi:translation initiation factor IF-2